MKFRGTDRTARPNHLSKERTRITRNETEDDRPNRCGMWVRVATETPTRYSAGPGWDRRRRAVRRKP